MKNDSRTTGSSSSRHEDVAWPTSAQTLRQLWVIALVVVLWSALLVGYQRVTGGSGGEPMAAQPEPARVMATPTTTLPAPTETVVAPIDTQAPPPTEEPSSLPAVSFSQDVFPILESRCVQCHGPSRTSGGVKTDSYDAVMAIVVPGDAAASPLVKVVVSGYMPRRGPKLLPSEIEIISAWVNTGAPDN